MTVYIDPPQAIAVVEHLGLRVRDSGLLFSALARPASNLFGEAAYATLELKAAALLSSLGQNHALFDGNKRLSLLLTFTFLRLNGRRVTFTNDEAFTLVLLTSQGKLSLEELSYQFATHTTPLPDSSA